MPSKSDQVYDYLRDEILNGKIPPGERLSMDGLARRLGVSKIPIREAMQRLETHGLVQQRPHVGPAVAPVTRHQLRGVYLTRQAVEPLVARLAAETISETQLIELDRVQMSMRQHLVDDALTEMSGLNSAFHQTIADAAGYEILDDVTSRLLMAIRRYRAVAPLDGSDWRDVITEHDAIIGALRHHDPEAAATAAHHHASSQAEQELRRTPHDG